TLIALPALIFGVWASRLQRQRALDRALLTAIAENDTPLAIALLDRGANPNAADAPAPPDPLWKLLWNRLRGRPRPPAHGYPALVAAVSTLEVERKPDGSLNASYPDHTRLVTALLDRGADVNASEPRGGTALLYTIDGSQFNTLPVLLRHSA